MANHQDLDVRLIAIHILGAAGQPAVLEALHNLLSESHSDVIREAVLEALARSEAPQNDQQTESAPTLEAVPDGEPEVPPTSAVEPQADAEVEPQSGFDLVPQAASQTEDEPQSEPEIQDPDSSGLPTPPIA